MKTITTDDVYPYHYVIEAGPNETVNHGPIPAELLERWEKIEKEMQKCQLEMSRFLKQEREKANSNAQR